MKVLIFLTLVTFICQFAQAGLFETLSNQNPTNPCLGFFLNLANSSIPPSNRSLETNITLSYSGHNLNDLGYYNLCRKLPTHNYTFIEYFLGGFSSFSIGFCGPWYCNTSELQKTADFVMETIYNITGKDFSKSLSIVDPHDTGIEKGFFFIFVIVIICVLGILVFMGTFSAYWRKSKDKSLNENTDSLSEAFLVNKESVNIVENNETTHIYVQRYTSPPNTPLEETNAPLLTKVIECFDLNENIKALFSNRIDPNHDANLNILNGIRAFCYGWVIYGHTVLSMVTAKNYAYLQMFVQSRWFLVLAGGFYSVDVFFYLSGFLTGFLLLSKLKNMSFGFKNYFKLFFHRWIRLWPSYFIAILIFWKLSVHYGNGVLWFSFVEQAQLCTGLAWKNLLFLDNAISEADESYCFAWGWYLACDFQMFLLSPFICWIYLNNKQRGLKLIWAFFFFCVVASYYESVNTGVTYLLAPNMKSDTSDYMFDAYANPLVRMSPYIVGLYFGCLFRDYKNGENNLFTTLKNSDSRSLISFVSGFALLLFIVFYPRTIQTGEKWTDGFSMSWGVFGRPFFAVAIFLMTGPGLAGNLKPLTYFLNNYYFTLIARISYTGYLVHYIFVMITIANSDQIRGFSEGSAMALSISNFGFSFFGAIALHLFVEKPFVNIESKIINRKMRAQVPCKN